MKWEEDIKECGRAGQWACRELGSAFEGILLQSERRRRSLATCPAHLDNEERQCARVLALIRAKPVAEVRLRLLLSGVVNLSTITVYSVLKLLTIYPRLQENGG